MVERVGGVAREDVAEPGREGTPDHDPRLVFSRQGVEAEEAGHAFGIVGDRGDRCAALDGLSTDLDGRRSGNRDGHRVHTGGNRPEGHGLDLEGGGHLRGAVGVTGGDDEAVQTGRLGELTCGANTDRADAGEQHGRHRKSGPSS